MIGLVDSKKLFQTPDLTITVPEGSYSPPNLAAAIQNKMNENNVIKISIINILHSNVVDFPNNVILPFLARTIQPTNGGGYALNAIY